MMTSPVQSMCSRTPGYKCNSADRSCECCYDEEEDDPAPPGQGTFVVPKPQASKYTAKTRKSSAGSSMLPPAQVVKTKTVKMDSAPSVVTVQPPVAQPAPAQAPVPERPVVMAENEGDELAVEAATQNPECGRCGAVLGIAAGIASRKCSVSLFYPLAPESPELRPLLGYVLAYSLGNVVRANELLGARHFGQCTTAQTAECRACP